MKIGLLTFWNGVNFGAFLQAYSLMAYLRESGFEVEIIPYKGSRHNLIENTYNLKRSLFDYREKGKQDKFKRCQMDFFGTNRVSKIKANLDFDFIIFGSDEIWNMKNKLLGFDKTYFGAFPFSGKRLAYATSFGNTESIKSRPEVFEYLNKFDGITVRDSNSMSILERLLEKKIEISLDPTFLIDHKIGEDKRKYHGKYIAVYSLSCSDTLMNHAKLLSKKLRLPLVSLGSMNRLCDYSEVNLSPFEWYDWIASSQYVVTSMFHGVVFSIISNIPFSLYIEEYRRNKFYPMMDKLEVTDRIVTDRYSCNDIEMNYNEVNRRLADWISTSKKWLIDALSSR